MISKRAFLVLLAGAAALSGCATPQLALSPEERKSLRIDSVKVTFTPEASLWWGNAEREYLAKVEANPASHPLTAPGRKPKRGEEPMDSAARAQEIMASPEAKAYMRDKLAAMLQKHVEDKVKPKFAGGSRPVNVVIEVGSFTIPSAAQRLVLGGSPMMGSVTHLVDARTGTEIGALKRVTAAQAGQGVIGVAVEGALGPLEDRVLDNYAEFLLRWMAGT